MKSQLTLVLTITIASVFASSHAEAGCGSFGCQTYYGPYSAHQAFILFQQRPEMIQQFPQIARELELQFGAIQPAVTPAPAVIPTPSSGISPAVAPAQIPPAGGAPAVIDPIPGGAATPAPGAPIVDPAQTAAPIELNANPGIAPVVQPTAEPPVNI